MAQSPIPITNVWISTVVKLTIKRSSFFFCRNNGCSALLTLENWNFFISKFNPLKWILDQKNNFYYLSSPEFIAHLFKLHVWSKLSERQNFLNDLGQVQIFWEGHKNLKKSPNFFEIICRSVNFKRDFSWLQISQGEKLLLKSTDL